MQESKDIEQFSNSPLNPINFSKWKKFYVVFVGLVSAFNSALGSSLPSGASPSIAQHFDVTDNTQLVLLNSLYMVGFAIGPLLFGPLSEYFGRRPIVIGTYVGLLIFTVACALAPTYSALLAFRLLAGVNAAAPNAFIGGLFSDVYDDPQTRGAALVCFMGLTSSTQPLGPLVSGFLSGVSWRWTFWTGSIIAGAGLPFVVLLPETYVPVLLARYQAKCRLTELTRQLSRQSLKETRKHLYTELFNVLARPFLLVITEPILLVSALYMAVVYALMFLFFQAYPIIFEGIYHLSISTTGLAFLPVVGGCVLAIPMFFWYCAYYARSVQAHKSWTSVEEYRRLPLACVGGPMLVISLFWLGWTSNISVPAVVPMMAGILFGSGYLLIFVGMLNYVTDFFKSRSASAHAAAATMRSIAAIGLPLATRPMYTQLGVRGANSLLGGIALLLSVVPFVFIRYRDFIRGRSSSLEEKPATPRRDSDATLCGSESEETLAASLHKPTEPAKAWLGPAERV